MKKIEKLSNDFIDNDDGIAKIADKVDEVINSFNELLENLKPSVKYPRNPEPADL